MEVDVAAVNASTNETVDNQMTDLGQPQSTLKGRVPCVQVPTTALIFFLQCVHNANLVYDHGGTSGYYRLPFLHNLSPWDPLPLSVSLLLSNPVKMVTFVVELIICHFRLRVTRPSHRIT